MAPASCAAKNATGHSGRLRMTTATRSPLTMPSATSCAASLAVARAKASNVTRSSSWTRKVRSPWARPARNTSRSVGGAFFHVRVGTPRMVTVSISNGAPAAVSIACACAIDMAGQAGAVSVIIVPMG